MSPPPGGGFGEHDEPHREPERDPSGTLLINEYGEDLREFKILGDHILIGRDPRGEVVLHDAGVSRAHARIRRKGVQFVLEDLGSRNGTLVNDRKLPENGTLPLNDGDSIRVGRSTLRLLLRGSERTPAGSRARPPSSTFSEDSTGVEKHGSICLFRLQKIQATLLVAPEGRNPRRERLFSDRVRIGRSSHADLVLDDPSVSHEHAEIVYNKEGFHLVDRDSTLGTFLNGVAVQVSRLAHRSFIKFGKVQALFLIEEEGREPPEASFRLRDRLLELYPEKEPLTQEAFRDCREGALDIAEELVLRGILKPEEWWATSMEVRMRTTGGARSWIARILRRG